MTTNEQIGKTLIHVNIELYELIDCNWNIIKDVIGQDEMNRLTEAMQTVGSIQCLFNNKTGQHAFVH